MRIESPKLINEFAQVPRCEVCGHNYVLHTHHEPTWGSAALETRLTLIRLCLDCHDARHSGDEGTAMRDRIVAAICRREKCSEEDREAVVMLLKRAPKDSERWWFLAESRGWSDGSRELLQMTLTEAEID